MTYDLFNVKVFQKMEKSFKRLKLNDIIVFKPKIFKDNRGLFFENFNNLIFEDFSGIRFKIIQENVSFSKKNVLRGLHFQKNIYAQAKLLSVLKGSILDVIVDIRVNSETFGKYITYVLDDYSKESIFIPKGFAHGFLSLDKNTIVSYKVDMQYNNLSEESIIWNDETLKINWHIRNPILSLKDKKAISFKKNIDSNNFV